jgi:tRNA (mo5U34)-methyltransferase
MAGADPTLAQEAAGIRWYHTIDLAPGLRTPGFDETAQRLDILRIPTDLSGRSVLDIGAWDGFFSFEAERRGARRVVATDSFAWRGDQGRAGFDLARRALGSRVEAVDVDVLDLSAQRMGTFDLVLFLGVLYHMRHPLLALERVADVCADQLIVETHVDMTATRRPAMAFYPSNELNIDPTNWWGPNPEAVVAMLKTVGFRRVEIVTPHSWPYRLTRIARRVPGHLRHLARHRVRPASAITQGRVVVHAFV